MTRHSTTKSIDIADLRIGMFVTRLEVAWSATEFPLQGILIRNRQDILKISTDKNALLSSDELVKARLFYEKYREQLQSVGFFIINREFINLASSRDENIGVSSFINDQRPELISEVFKGIPAFTNISALP